jgi:hypothetical protein
MSAKKPGRISHEDVHAHHEQHSYQVARVEEIGRTVRIVCVCLLIGFLGYCARLAVADLAGRVTDANIAMRFLGDLQASISLAWVIGAGGAAYGYGQNRLRKRTVTHLGNQNRALELRLDARRSSSELSPTGDTNPGDE